MILTTKINNENERIINNEPNKRKCIYCNEIFNSNPKRTRHINTNIYCKTMNEIQKQTLINCRNENCETMWKNENERNKHEKYHCHLPNGEKTHLCNNEHNNNNCASKLNRKIQNNFGLPNTNTEYNNGKVIYDVINKNWICTICNFTRNKYNSEQVMNHVNSKHTENNKQIK